jgi:hypothetical protein
VRIISTGVWLGGCYRLMGTVGAVVWVKGSENKSIRGGRTREAEGGQRICEADAAYDGRVGVQQPDMQACRRCSGLGTRKFSPARKIQNGVVL